MPSASPPTPWALMAPNLLPLPHTECHSPAALPQGLLRGLNPGPGGQWGGLVMWALGTSCQLHGLCHFPVTC